MLVLWIISLTAWTVGFALTFDAGLGRIVLCGFLVAYVVMILTLVAMVGRLPPSLVPPKAGDAEGLDLYLRAVGERLEAICASNSNCATTRRDCVPTSKPLFRHLDRAADELILRDVFACPRVDGRFPGTESSTASPSSSRKPD